MKFKFETKLPKPAPTPQPIEAIVINGAEIGEIRKAEHSVGCYVASVYAGGKDNYLLAGYGVNEEKVVAVEQAIDELRGKVAAINKFMAEVAA